MKQSHDLMNSLQHIERIIDKQSSHMVEKNHLRLKVSIDVAKLCVFQGIAFRARDECPDSSNRGNFLEIIRHTTCYSEEVNSVVLGKAPQNASYTSPQIQKEILFLYASRIQRFIREEIDDAKFCIIVDESRDESKREQMAIVLRFVDKDGFIRERFFNIVHVEDTRSATLKREISTVLSRNNLIIQNICGQGYDGASTLVLVVVAKSVIPVEHFFSHLNVIVNLVDSSSKRNDQLQSAQAIQIEELRSTNELETERGKNQIGSVQCPGDTRWGSHLRSLHSVHNMFKPILLVLEVILNEKNNLSFKATTDGAYDMMTSFEFVFILHFMMELLKLTDDLCGILQCKNQDILNAMDAIINTKELIRRYRESGYDKLLDEVKGFCEKYKIEIPDMNGPRCSETTDVILQEMKNRFNDDAIELLRLSSAVDPRDGYKSFSIDNICELMEKFYPDDFTSQEKFHMKYQLELFELDIRCNEFFQNVSTLAELCQLLSKTDKKMNYYLVDRLVRLILTLSVSTATTERAFSSMKIVKTRLRNKMEDVFWLAHY